MNPDCHYGLSINKNIIKDQLLLELDNIDKLKDDLEMLLDMDLTEDIEERIKEQMQAKLDGIKEIMHNTIDQITL